MVTTDSTLFGMVAGIVVGSEITGFWNGTATSTYVNDPSSTSTVGVDAELTVEIIVLLSVSSCPGQYARSNDAEEYIAPLVILNRDIASRFNIEPVVLL